MPYQFETTQLSDLSPDVAERLAKTDLIMRSYLGGVQFICFNTARDPSFKANHLLLHLAEDFFQSAVSLRALAMESLGNVAKRELRFMIEASIKLCFVQQHGYDLPISDKLQKFERVLSSQRVSVQRNLNLFLLPEDLRPAFVEEVGRLTV